MRFFALTELPAGEDDAEMRFLPVGKVRYAPPDTCSACGGYITSRLRLPPFVGSIRLWGMHFADVADPGFHTLLSDRFVQEWEKSGLRGFNILGEVQIKTIIPRKRAVECPRYWLARPTNYRVTFDPVASGAVFRGSVKCEACLGGAIVIRHDRIVLRLEQWRGEDIFVTTQPGDVFVTEHFKEFCERHQMRQVHFVPAEEFSYDEDAELQ